MRKVLFLALSITAMTAIWGQQVVQLQENTPHEHDGLEYGYYITNETSKEVKGENFDRFEVNLYVANKNNCIRLIPFRPNYSGTGSSSSTDEVQIAEYNCTNATGKRLTAKKGTVAAKPWYTNVRVPDETTKEKFKTIYAQVGYAIRGGQTFTNRIIVIVPRGERPKLNCRIIYIPELQ